MRTIDLAMDLLDRGRALDEGKMTIKEAKAALTDACTALPLAWCEWVTGLDNAVAVSLAFSAVAMALMEVHVGHDFEVWPGMRSGDFLALTWDGFDLKADRPPLSLGGILDHD